MSRPVALEEKRELPRLLGVWDAAAVVVGIVIGSGIFVLPNVIARALPSRPAILAAWVIAGVLSFFGALAYAELGAMMPATGGQYVYLREAYGPMWAFVCGWTFTLAVTTGGAAWLSVTFSIYAGYFVPLTPVTSHLLSIAVITFFCLLNYVGVKEGARAQVLLCGLKVAGLVVLTGAAFLAPGAGHAIVPDQPVTLGNFGVAMTACLMAYNGWSYVSFVAGEVSNPQRNLLRSLVYGVAGAAALYLLANAAYMRVLTIPQIAASERVGAEVAMRTMGSIGGSFVALTVLLSIAGAINGCMLTGARLPFAQARDGLFFAGFGEVHPRFRTPGKAVILSGVWTVVLILTGSYDTLYSYSIVAAWVFYTMTVAAVIVLRRKLPDAPRPYRMWGYPYTIWVFVLVSVWYLVNAFVTEPVPSAMALLIMAGGVIAYWIWRARMRHTEPRPSR